MTEQEKILAREYAAHLDELRKKLVLTSFFKYGPAAENFGKGRVSALGSAKKCRAKYIQTGNKEYLLDEMNYLMFEFMYPSIPEAFYQPTDSKGSAGTDGTPFNMEVNIV